MCTQLPSLARRLRASGADFEIVGSTAAGAPTPADLDVVVRHVDEDLERFISAVAAIGGWSLLSPSLPSAESVRRAGVWHYGTPEGPLDVFVERE